MCTHCDIVGMASLQSITCSIHSSWCGGWACVWEKCDICCRPLSLHNVHQIVSYIYYTVISDWFLSDSQIRLWHWWGLVQHTSPELLLILVGICTGVFWHAHKYIGGVPLTQFDTVLKHGLHVCPWLLPSVSFVYNICLCHILSLPDGRLFSIFKADIFVRRVLPPSPSPVLTDCTGSEENIGISVLGLQSKLNLPFKNPPSHNHKPEAYPSRPGYSYSEQIHVDGGYFWECVCVYFICVWLYMVFSPYILSGFNQSCCKFCLAGIIFVQMLMLLHETSAHFEPMVDWILRYCLLPLLASSSKLQTLMKERRSVKLKSYLHLTESPTNKWCLKVASLTWKHSGSFCACYCRRGQHQWLVHW